jgi:hypothetical protein
MGTTTSVDDVFRSLRDTDPDVLDSDELDAYLRRLSELKAWCESRQVRATRRQRQLAADGRAGDPRGSLSNHGRQSGKEAAAAAEREQVCSTMPGFEDALENGEVTAGHVDAIASATKDLDDEARAEFADQADDLLTNAKDQSVDRFTKGCRDLAKGIRARQNSRSDVDELEQQRKQSKISRWVDKTTGMHKTLIECDPVTDRVIWAGIQRERRRLRRRQRQTGSRATRAGFDRLQVDALASAVSGQDRADGSAGPAIVAHIDVHTLTDGRHDATLCETDSGVPIPVEVARRLACEAGIIPVVLDGRGVVLDEGRAKRLATFEQRVAIEAMQSTCSHPDCRVTIDDCRIHHLDLWSRGGRTDLDEMAPLCETHHHLVHEGGWTLTMTPDRVATWIRPDGQVYWTGSLIDRRAA